MTNEIPPIAPRRTFFARILAVGAGLGLTSVARRVGAGEPTAGHGDPRLLRADAEPWMQRLSGTNRVIFHSHLAADGLAITWARTFLDTQKTTYGLRDTESGVIVGLNGRSIGLFFNDTMWGKYPIAETMLMKGTVNPNGAAGNGLVAALIARGAIMLVCNNSLRASGSRFLPEPARSDTAARTAFADEATANLLPGVEVVPAMVVALQRAQDLGCRYIYAVG